MTDIKFNPNGQEQMSINPACQFNEDRAPMHYYQFNEDGTHTRSDLHFRDNIESNIICFHKNSVEVLRLDKEGMIFMGQRITDAGEAYEAWMKTMAMMQGEGE